MSLKTYNKSPIGPSVAPKGIHLLLTGFHQQELVPTDVLVQQINRLPDTHLAGLKQIIYDPARQAAPWRPWPWHRSRHCKGEFLQGERRIVIYTFDTAEELLHILLHEIGHYVYAVTLDKTVKKHWVTTVRRKGYAITPLARRNACEDFAECYATYCHSPHVLEEQAPEKHAFFRDRVFHINKAPKLDMRL